VCIAIPDYGKRVTRLLPSQRSRLLHGSGQENPGWQSSSDQVAAAGKDGESELTVKLTNRKPRQSVEWEFASERNYGPLYTDEWGQVLRDIVDGMDTT
jgi:hypothetical protein